MFGKTSSTHRHRVYRKINTERSAQDKKWGVQHHPASKWLAILVEEVGELAREVLEGNDGALGKELRQVAAVSVAWMEARYREEAARSDNEIHDMIKDKRRA